MLFSPTDVLVHVHCQLSSDCRERIGHGVQEQARPQDHQRRPSGAFAMLLLCSFHVATHIQPLQVDSPGDNTVRTTVDDPGYLQIVLYDHMTRRKA
jgi:hypothetical protein